MRLYSAKKAIYATGNEMFRSKLLIGLNLSIGVTFLVFCIITMEVRSAPRGNLCNMANVIESKSYQIYMTIISMTNVSCLLGSDIVSILALVFLNKALRTVQPALDPVQSATTSETYKVHKAIFRTLILVLTMYHLTQCPFTIGVIFASMTNTIVPNVVARILVFATYVDAISTPLIIITRQAKVKRSIIQDFQDLRRAVCLHEDREI
ncbi:hypothetical protein DPMN_114875 [Dreissena polymorpha]|uniref:Uncharacterized protein n=1 Tax=Dreissena polymorpha TaxID=45954 RepID=A0A9D4QSW4_DREPO|nr:hypothetical protein DPMN_114875 [Dreissena polymorpha]